MSRRANGYERPVGVGLFLMVIGAILTFAVDDEVPNVNLAVVGLILMIAGVAVILHARAGTHHEQVVTRVDDPPDPAQPPHVIKETTRYRDYE
jgi:hypothetical protein